MWALVGLLIMLMFMLITAVVERLAVIYENQNTKCIEAMLLAEHGVIARQRCRLPLLDGALKQYFTNYFSVDFETL